MPIGEPPNPFHFGIPVTPWYPRNPVPTYPGNPAPNSGGKMAKYEDPKLTVSLDDESKELLRALVKAVDRLAPDEATDVSFGDTILPKSERTLKRLVEPETITRYSALQPPVKRIQYGGRYYDLIEGSAGDYLLHDDGHEGEEIE